jgi:Mlc titration factor MtfA (ptsG expression regulator)
MIDSIFCYKILAIRAGNSDIDAYGSTNEAEYFSVVSEYFFQQPQQLKKHHPVLFDMLERIFKQDLA